MLVLILVKVDSDKQVITFPANPGTSPTLLVCVLGHILVLLKNGVGAIVVDPNAVTPLKRINDRLGALFVKFV